MPGDAVIKASHFHANGYILEAVNQVFTNEKAALEEGRACADKFKGVRMIAADIGRVNFCICQLFPGGLELFPPACSSIPTVLRNEPIKPTGSVPNNLRENNPHDQVNPRPVKFMKVVMLDCFPVGLDYHGCLQNRDFRRGRPRPGSPLVRPMPVDP